MLNIYSKQYGFSLVEISMVVLISGILGAAAAPLVTQYSNDANVAGVQSKLSEAFSHARQMAVSQGETVGVCASADGKTCAAGDWSKGWIVYVEQESRDSNQDVDKVVDSYAVEDAELKLSVLDEQLNPLPSVRFDSRGFSLARSRVLTQFCTKDNAAGFDTLIVERMGRMRFVGKELNQNQDGGLRSLCMSS